MIGFIIGIVGIYTALSLWRENQVLTIVAGIAVLFQFSSLIEMRKEIEGLQPEDKTQSSINMIASLVIIVIFLSTLF